MVPLLTYIIDSDREIVQQFCAKQATLGLQPVRPGP